MPYFREDAVVEDDDADAEQVGRIFTDFAVQWPRLTHVPKRFFSIPSAASVVWWVAKRTRDDREENHNASNSFWVKGSTTRGEFPTRRNQSNQQTAGTSDSALATR